MSGGHQQPRALRGKDWCACAGQDWDTGGKGKGTVQLTGCGQCCVCMCAQRGRAGGPKGLVIVTAGKRERDHRKNAGKMSLLIAGDWTR